MKIAITSEGPNLDSQIDPRFGRCSYFLIVDETGKLIKTVKNTSSGSMRGAGVTAAQIVVDEKVDVLITGNIGPNAVTVMKESGIKMFAGIFEITAEKALNMYKNNELKETTTPSKSNNYCK